MGSVTARARTRGQLVDEAALRRIASLTGGAYFRATDVGSLQQAYQEIDRLETTEVDVGSLYDYQEAHEPWIVLGGLVIGASALSRRAWFEVLP
jgi:Ca-activated chloride channel family protein